jgi:cyanophycinase
MGEKVRGNLVVIGGAEDKYGESEILREVVEIIGGDNAKLVVLTTATEQPTIVGDEYRTVFEKLGIPNIDILNINSRYDANREYVVKTIEKSTGIFFTGGDQLRITSILGGTKAYAAMPLYILCFKMPLRVAGISFT